MTVLKTSSRWMWQPSAAALPASLCKWARAVTLHGHVQVIEAACFSSTASKTVYISKLAKHVSAAKTCESVQALLHIAGATVQGPPVVLSEVRSAGVVISSVDPDVKHSCSGATKHNRIKMMPQREGRLRPHEQSDLTALESSASGGGSSAHGASEECQEEVTKLRGLLTAAAQKRQRDMIDAGGAYAGPYAELR